MEQKKKKKKSKVGIFSGGRKIIIIQSLKLLQIFLYQYLKIKLPKKNISWIKTFTNQAL